MFENVKFSPRKGSSTGFEIEKSRRDRQTQDPARTGFKPRKEDPQKLFLKISRYGENYAKTLSRKKE